MPGPVVFISPNNSGYNAHVETFARAYDLEFKAISFAGKAKNDDLKWEKIVEAVRGASFVFIWNGCQHRGRIIADHCERFGVPTAYVEYGMLPQKGSMFVDPGGFCGRSILNKQLSWVTSKDLEHLHTVRADLQRNYPITDEGFVLIPLQVLKDTQILQNSAFRSMRDFVMYVASVFPGQKIVVREHPTVKRRAIHIPCEYVVPEDAGPFMAHAARCSSVVSVTSTCLYEAAILGKPVMAIGDHPLRTHGPQNRERVLAGALALRVSCKNPDFVTPLNRFNLRPLGSDPIGGV